MMKKLKVPLITGTIILLLLTAWLLIRENRTHAERKRLAEISGSPSSGIGVSLSDPSANASAPGTVPHASAQPEPRPSDPHAAGTVNPAAIRLFIKGRVQETTFNCVPACVQAVLSYHGIDIDQQTLAQEMKTQPDIGTEYEEMAQVLNRHLFALSTSPQEGENGYRVQRWAPGGHTDDTRALFEQRVRQGIEAGYPVFAAIDMLTFYPELFEANHMVTVIGYLLDDESGRISDFYFLDSSRPVQDAVYGGLKRATAAEMFAALTKNQEPGYLTADPSSVSTPVQSVRQPKPSAAADPDPSASASPTDGAPEAAVNPSAIRLRISQSVQQNSYYCVPACVQSVLAYHGTQVSQKTLAEQMNTSSVTGTEYADQARVLNHYLFSLENPPQAGEAGYRVQTLAIGDRDPAARELFEKRVRQGIEAGYPVFAAVDVLGLYPELFSGNHMITVVGYLLDDSSGRITDFYYLDPSYLVQDAVHGGLKRATAAEMFEAIITNEEPAYLW